MKNHILRRRRFVIGDIVDPGGWFFHRSGADGPGNVGNMDAVEHLARLYQPAGRPLPEIFKRVPARAVNSRQSERSAPGGSWRSAKDSQSVFGPNALDGALRNGFAGGVLINPGTVMIAIDPDRGQISDPVRPGGGNVSPHAVIEDRVAGFARPDGDQHMGRRLARASAIPSPRSCRRRTGTVRRPVTPQGFGFFLQIASCRRSSRICCRISLAMKAFEEKPTPKIRTGAWFKAPDACRRIS